MAQAFRRLRSQATFPFVPPGHPKPSIGSAANQRDTQPNKPARSVKNGSVLSPTQPSRRLRRMAARILFVTGTDTGVGKTLFAALLTAHLRSDGLRVAALKPVSSGNRSDARLLRLASANVLTLVETNPWHFRAPLTPMLAARRERRRVWRCDVLAHIRRIARRFDVLVVEGAGGLLSPLGEDFDSRDLIVALRALPIIVGPNRLGAINQVLLVLEALPPAFRKEACVVLSCPRRMGLVARTNAELLARRLGASRLHLLPQMRLASPLQPSRRDRPKPETC
jgi:dethiobiotin synthetase